MKGLRLGLGRTLRCSPHPNPSLQPAVHGNSGTPQPWRGPRFLPTHSSLCQSQSCRVFLQVFLSLGRAGGCKLPSSFSTEAAEQPVSRAPVLRHPGVCGAVEPGWGAASYLIFSSTLISLVILPVTNRVKQSNPLKKQPDRPIVKGFSDPHLHWLEKNFASSSSNYRIIRPHSGPFVHFACLSSFQASLYLVAWKW